ncbi:helix-turn-helix transcriptional regulator [Streptomyces sp. NPDC006624]|uniref:helix-turn-helix transcriptional regulator n=1 Tax=Streptomyces sp. NPDC006624 TaxID=3154892 RepID=UPI0033B51A37
MSHRIRRVPPADLGALLRVAREQMELRQVEAAFLAGVSRSHLANMEAGRRLPSVSVARALADVLCLEGGDRERLLSVAVDDAGRDHPERSPVVSASPDPGGVS